MGCIAAVVSPTPGSTKTQSSFGVLLRKPPRHKPPRHLKFSGHQSARNRGLVKGVSQSFFSEDETEKRKKTEKSEPEKTTKTEKKKRWESEKNGKTRKKGKNRKNTGKKTEEKTVQRKKKRKKLKKMTRHRSGDPFCELPKEIDIQFLLP